MEQNSSWEANRFSASQEIPHIHTCPPPVTILSQIDLIHAPTSHFLMIHPNVIFPSTPWFFKWSPAVRLSTNTLYTPLFSPIRAICPAHLILLDLIIRTILGEWFYVMYVYIIYIYNITYKYTRRAASKSLARPARKQVTATKLGIYSTYSPRSSIHFLARCSNFCKPLEKKNQVVRSTRTQRQQWPPRWTKNDNISIVFSVQVVVRRGQIWRTRWVIKTLEA